MQVAIGLVGVVALIIYGFQLSEMRKSTDAAAKAAKAAGDAVAFARESAHLDQRAWVASVGISGGLPAPDTEFMADVRIKNGGKTFAKNVMISWHFRGIPAPELPDFSDTAIEVANSVGLLPPDGEYVAKVSSPKLTSDQAGGFVTLPSWTSRVRASSPAPAFLERSVKRRLERARRSLGEGGPPQTLQARAGRPAP